MSVNKITKNSKAWVFGSRRKQRWTEGRTASIFRVADLVKVGAEVMWGGNIYIWRTLVSAVMNLRVP